MSKKETERKKREKEERELEEQRAAPRPAVKVKSPYHNSKTVVQTARTGQEISLSTTQEAESTHEQSSKVSLARKVGGIGGILMATAGLGSVGVSQPHGVTHTANATQSNKRGDNESAVQAHRQETPPKTVCEIKITVRAGEENSADVKRLVSTIEKAACEHPEEPAPQVDRKSGGVTIWLAVGGLAVSALSAAQPTLLQLAKGSEGSVKAKFKNKNGEEEEITVTGTSDVERVCNALRGMRR
jgi:hypothetical protein